jgi:hypothetical protein
MRGFPTVVLLLVVVTVLGMVLPRFIIGTGVNLYEGDYKKLAQQAISETDIFFAGSPDVLLITAKRVMKVGTCTAYPPDFDNTSYVALQGEVQLYTIFGIPYGELIFQCEGTEIILCPQNTAECPPGHTS